MNRPEIKSKITEFLKIKSEIDAAYELMRDATGMTPDSKIGLALYKSLDAYLKILEQLINPNSDWIEWFVWENDCGKKGMEAGYNGNLNPIKTVDDLIELINEA